MKKLLLVILLSLPSLAGWAQGPCIGYEEKGIAVSWVNGDTTISYEITQNQVIALIRCYDTMWCTWIPVLSPSMDTIGYQKRLTIFPKDTTIIQEMYFCSNIVPSKANENLLQGDYAQIGSATIYFTEEDWFPFQYPPERSYGKLAKEVAYQLRMTPPGVHYWWHLTNAEPSRMTEGFAIQEKKRIAIAKPPHFFIYWYIDTL